MDSVHEKISYNPPSYAATPHLITLLNSYNSIRT